MTTETRCRSCYTPVAPGADYCPTCDQWKPTGYTVWSTVWIVAGLLALSVVLAVTL